MNSIEVFEPDMAKKESPTPHQVIVRVSDDLEEQLVLLERLMRVEADARGEDPAIVTRSYTVRKALRLFVASSFARVGGMPTDEAGWAKIEAKVKELAGR